MIVCEVEFKFHKANPPFTVGAEQAMLNRSTRSPDCITPNSDRTNIVHRPTYTLRWRVAVSAFAMAAVVCGLFAPANLLAAETVKVFVLAGQSNMQGHGIVAAEERSNAGKGSLEWLTTNPATSDKYGHLVDAAGNWVSRDDVYISYLERKGPLAPGYGHKEGYIGPELGFGVTVGDAIDEPVLLIKIAWGGKSLAKDFRPPSAGGEVGPYYQDTVKITKQVLNDAGKLFPELADAKFELVGFGWHQGWNDRVNQAANDAYEQNMIHFINDIRKDLAAPGLPFVIAETGMSGREETHPRALSLMKAQAAAAKHEAFKGTVAFVGTRDFYRPKETSPSGQAYHWNNNAETYYLIGQGMGKAMLKLVQGKE